MKKNFLIVSLLLLLPVLLFAGTTGKIVGTVIDSETGDTLPGANVVIQGTTLGASTDLSGYFVILNVPVGTYSVRTSFIGFQSVIKQNIRVSIDLTTTTNFSMSAETIGGEEITIIAVRELIRKDETNTNIIRTAEEIEMMPVRNIQDLTASIAGVVKQDNSNTMNIRGGRGSESAVYIDGVLANDPYNGAVRAYLPNEAIEEMSVQTGGFSAEYGEAMSGIVLVTTNSGSKKYFGSVQVITDGLMSETKKALGTYSYGYNEYVMTFGGPIWPGKNHTFFVSGTRQWMKDGGPSYGWAENENKPEGFEGGVVPGAVDNSWNFTAKAKLQLMDNMELKGSVVWSDKTSGSAQMNPIWLYNVDHAPEMYTYHKSYNVTLTHVLKSTTFYDLKVNYFDTFREIYDRSFGDNFLSYGDPTQVPNESWAANNENYGSAYTGRVSPDFFAAGAPYDDYFKNKTTYWGLDFDITHQYGKHHTFKAGFDYKNHTLREFRYLGPSKIASRADISELERYRNADVRFYGYDIFGSEVSDGDYLTDAVRSVSGTPTDGYQKQAPYNPITSSAYIQDKIEFKDLILNLGLRYDRIDPNAWMFKQLEAEYDADGNYVDGTGMFGGDNLFSGDDTKESEAFDYFSPRVGVSFPVDDRTVFHAQYGKFYQSPSLNDLYLSPFYLDAFVNRGGYFTVLDNPNLKPPKTTAYEIGFKRSFGSNMSLQLTAFYKETEDLIQVLNINTDVTNIAFTNNGDFGVIKGFDVIFNLRRTKNLSATANYEFQTAKGTGSATNGNFDIAWLGGARGNFPKFIQPLDYEQRHTATVNLDYRFANDEAGIFENSGLNVLFSYNSGRPFTMSEVRNTLPFTGRYDNDISNTPVSSVNGALTPMNYRMDLKINKIMDVPFV
ncbi:TonB-dependent receptor, partial [bacterium]|nr:TonB-dependent receptor [bacterium]